MAEMGECLVGAYLREILGCEIVVYNQRVSRKKGEFGELDVLGIDATRRTAYFCEVTTHLGGVLYSVKGKDNSLVKVSAKFASAKKYAERAFPKLKKRYMFWAPRLRSGLVKQLSPLGPKLGIKIDFVVNEGYSRMINELREKAKKDRRNTGDPFYRVLQIIENAVRIKE
jgi:hypothetical protein